MNLINGKTVNWFSLKKNGLDKLPSKTIERNVTSVLYHRRTSRTKK